MAESFTFVVGDLDLSDHVRVSPGEGLEPYAPGLVEPQFSQSPARDGRRLIDVNVGLEERVFPVFLNDGSAPQLRALEQSINRELDRAPGLPMEWRPPGSGSSTFYDIEFGRFEPDYNFRRDQQGWMAGVLRLQTQPYGHTGTERIVATGMATGVAAAVFPVPSLAGDAAAPARLGIGVGSYPAPAGRHVLAARLPHPSWAAIWPAASLGAVAGGSGAHASQYLDVGPISVIDTEPFATLALAPASIYQGHTIRALAIARGDEQLSLRGPDGKLLGDPAMATAMEIGREWGLVDLGVFSLPETPELATYTIALHANRPTALNEWYREPLALTMLALLPERETVLVKDSDLAGLAEDTFRNDFRPPGPLTGGTQIGHRDHFGYEWRMPISPMAAHSFHRHWSEFGGLLRPAALASGGPHRMANTVFVPGFTDGRVDAVFEAERLYDGARPSHLIGVHRDMASSARGANQVASGQARALVAEVRALGSGALFHLLELSSSTSVVASLYLPSQADEDFVRLALDNRGNRVWATLEHDRGSVMLAGGSVFPYASLGGTSSLLGLSESHPGAHMMASCATSGAVEFLRGYLEAFRCISIPSRGLAPADSYQLDSINESRWRANPSGGWAEDIAGRSRGGPLKLQPPAAAIAVVAMPADRGPAGDMLSVEVRARERFRFAR